MNELVFSKLIYSMDEYPEPGGGGSGDEEDEPKPPKPPIPPGGKCLC